MSKLIKMILIYTVCTGNFLGHATSFYNSLQKFAPDIQFVACLVETKNAVKPFLKDIKFEINYVEDIDGDQIDEMSKKYNIHELTCAYKPIFGASILKNNPQIDELWYFDGDILLFNNPRIISEELKDHSILLTPHFFSSYNDQKHQSERDFLNSGLYNAGFFAVKNDQIAKYFFEWWSKKTRFEGYLRYDLGMGSDQLWFNFVPLFFNKVNISKHLGLNVAYWNLHERKISKLGNTYRINQDFDLVFFHFSGYSLEKPNEISRHQNRFQLENDSILSAIFQEYRSSLETAHYSVFTQIKSEYNNRFSKRSLSESIIYYTKRTISHFAWKVLKKVEQDPKIW